MNPTPELPFNQPKARGLHVGIVLLACFLFLLAGAAFWYFSVRALTSEKAALARERERLTNQTERAELERAKAGEDAKLALARNRQDELLSQARNATNAIGQLRVSVENLKVRTETLKTSEEGRKLALHPDLVNQARRVYEKDIPGLPTIEQMNARLEGARRIEQQVRSNLGTAYEPEANLSIAAQSAAIWADQVQQAVLQSQTLLTALIQESEIKITTAKLTQATPTLATQMSQLIQAETSDRQRVTVEKTAEAKSIAAETLAEAEAEKILADARRKAEKIVEEAKAAVLKQQRESAQRQALDGIEATRADLARQAAENESLKLRLRQKVSAETM